MIEINFQPVFNYIDNRLLSFKDEVLAEVRLELEPIKNTLNSIIKDNQKFWEEMAISGHRIDRLEQWAEPVGKELGYSIKL